jgi:hypothetical protein
MSYILVTASNNRARDRLNKVFNNHSEDLKVSKICARAYLVKDNGCALERAYREKLRDSFGIDLYFVEEIHDRDIPVEVQKNAEWHINHPSALPQQKNQAIERTELISEDELEQCQVKMKCTRISDEKR